MNTCINYTTVLPVDVAKHETVKKNKNGSGI